MESKELTLAAIIAALYATLVVVLMPISYGPIQLRIADCLIPLSAILGWPAVYGVSLGALIGNAYYMQFTGLIDVVFGALANFIAATAVLKLKKTPLLGYALASMIVGIIVGGYLWIYFPPPPIFGLPMWLAMIVSITLSSFVAILIIGGTLVVAIKTRLQ